MEITDPKRETTYNNKRYINKRLNDTYEFMIDLVKPGCNVLFTNPENIFELNISERLQLKPHFIKDCDLDYGINVTGKFDYICSFAVLEHKLNPLLYIENLRQHTDGYLFVRSLG